MNIRNLEGKKVVIWGAGKEGTAAAKLIHSRIPHLPLIFIDEGVGDLILDLGDCSYEIVRDAARIEQVLSSADVVVKSPGISLARPLLEKEQARGVQITSLLNLWFDDNKDAFIIGVTGTKGKSTTSALLHHTLTGLGKKAALLGNIGTPVTECTSAGVDFLVVEVSSYQAANFSGNCKIGVLTSLYPEHLDWHRTLARYYHDKMNLLRKSDIKILENRALATLEEHHLLPDYFMSYNNDAGIHFVEGTVFDGTICIGQLDNQYLLKEHNKSNVCAVLSVIKTLALDLSSALKAMEGFQGLPHRQYELGEKNGVLYVDDSISTTPQSAIAAIEGYKARPVTVILGGFDRGIDYQPLVDYIQHNKINATVCMGASGERIFSALSTLQVQNCYLTTSLQDATLMAQKITPTGGVILLSPAAPSFGMFKNYIERAECFVDAVGFS